MARKKPDEDFDIYVDPSCLSNPIDDESMSQNGDDDVRDSVESEHVVNEAETTPKEEDEASKTDAAESPADEASTEDVPTLEAPTDDADPDDIPVEDTLPDEIPDGAASAEDVSTEDDAPAGSAPADGTEDSTPTPGEDVGAPEESTPSERRPSFRTEALIKEAARDIVAQIEQDRNPGGDSGEREDTHAGDETVVVKNAEESCADGAASATNASSRRESGAHDVLPSIEQDDEQGRCTPNEHEGSTSDDVFSERSPRSSLGSFDSSHGEDIKHAKFHDDVSTTSYRSPRISDMSQYERDDDEFVPNERVTPRPPFRTPSDVRAIQMSSPAPSVFAGQSPRSTKRQFPTISRLGSPVSQHYNSRRGTPTRFKPAKQEAPLVLLHATLLPLRWQWGDMLNDYEGFTLKDLPEPSEPLKSLRDAWRQLQDRVGDTVTERGILLGHPQDDFEVLEERLLEALELPMRQRARILECGHYLGPANEMMLEDEDSEDEYAAIFSGSCTSSSSADKRHWCHTCKHEIKYDALSARKVFRVKVYASNGLMKAGAWAACWKEMERVDIELEPIVDRPLHEELERIEAAIHQARLEEEAQMVLHEEPLEEDGEHDEHEEQEPSFMEKQDNSELPLSSPGTQLHHSPEPDLESFHQEEQRLLREIYGSSPPPSQLQTNLASSPPQPQSQRQQPAEREPEPAYDAHDSYFPQQQTPPSPCESAASRRQSRQAAPYQNASLPELLVEAAKVALQDRKNVAIALLAVLVMLLAVRTAPSQPAAVIHFGRPMADYRPEMVTTAAPVITTEPAAKPEVLAPAEAKAEREPTCQPPVEEAPAVDAPVEEVLPVEPEVEEVPSVESEEEQEVVEEVPSVEPEAEEVPLAEPVVEEIPSLEPEAQDVLPVEVQAEEVPFEEVLSGEVLSNGGVPPTEAELEEAPLVEPDAEEPSILEAAVEDLPPLEPQVDEASSVEPETEETPVVDAEADLGSSLEPTVQEIPSIELEAQAASQPEAMQPVEQKVQEPQPQQHTQTETHTHTEKYTTREYIREREYYHHPSIHVHVHTVTVTASAGPGPSQAAQANNEHARRPMAEHAEHYWRRGSDSQNKHYEEAYYYASREEPQPTRGFAELESDPHDWSNNEFEYETVTATRKRKTVTVTEEVDELETAALDIA